MFLPPGAMIPDNPACQTAPTTVEGTTQMVEGTTAMVEGTTTMVEGTTTTPAPTSMASTSGRTRTVFEKDRIYGYTLCVSSQIW